MLGSGRSGILITHFLGELFQAVVDAQTVFCGGGIVVQTGKQTHGRQADTIVKSRDFARHDGFICIIGQVLLNVCVSKFQCFFGIVGQ